MRKIDQILSAPVSSLEKSQAIKALFTVEAFPDDLKQRILSEMGKIADVHVAVRSSSTMEDLPGMSFAGQYSSYLHVTASWMPSNKTGN